MEPKQPLSLKRLSINTILKNNLSYNELPVTLKQECDNFYVYTFPFLDSTGAFSWSKYWAYWDNEKVKTHNDHLRGRVPEGCRRHIGRVENEGLVFNVIQHLSIAPKSKNVETLVHKNIERILYSYDDGKYWKCWITPLFVTKLKTVWEEQTYMKFDIKKIFLDLLSGLQYLHSNNFIHETIHEDNLAFNGTNWYISGILQPEKLGELASAAMATCSLKSRRQSLCSSSTPIPFDDLWQLILMYVITYYGFNPFYPNAYIGQIRTINILENKIITNIAQGRCCDIKLDKTCSSFGQNLKKILLVEELLCNLDSINWYDEFKNIIINNTDVCFGQLIQRADTFQAETECIICFDKPVELRFYPCNHKICCSTCSKRLKACPICRVQIEMFILIGH
jgi:serine/threonine protein kinase